MKILILLIIQFDSYSAFGQNMVKGLVTDENSLPFAGANICQGSSRNCTVSNANGAYQLVLDLKQSNTLTFSFIGYKRVEVNLNDSLSKDISIQMFPDDSFTDPVFLNYNYDTDPNLKGWGFVASLQIDMIQKDFKHFSTLLGSDNINLLNTPADILNWELSVSFKRYQAGLILGWPYTNNYDNDSLDFESKNDLYGLSIGYKIVDSRRFALVPKFALKWYRFKLTNSDIDRQISLNQYMTDRDLDIRFNQAVGFVGASLSYKIYKNYNLIPSDHWSIGIYGGYIFKINQYPWIYSKQNRIIDDNKILMNHLNMGISFSFIID